MLVYCTDAEEAVVVVGEMCIILYAVFEKGTNFFGMFLYVLFPLTHHQLRAYIVLLLLNLLFIYTLKVYIIIVCQFMLSF